MMNVEEQQAVLHELPVFAGLDAELRQRTEALFLAIGHVREIAAGTLVFKQGEPGGVQGYVLLGGEIQVEKSTGAPFTCGPPVLLGEMQQFNPVGLRTATVRAQTALEVLAFDWESFHNALDERFAEEERDTLVNALRDYAWKHFLA